MKKIVLIQIGYYVLFNFRFPFIKKCIKADCRTSQLQEHLARLALTVCQLVCRLFNLFTTRFNFLKLLCLNAADKPVIILKGLALSR